MKQELAHLIDYYRSQGAPQDQQMLIALLREAQEMHGGILTQEALAEIMEAYALKAGILQAIIRRVPSLRSESVPHKLEICGTCPAGRKLREEIERRYEARGGTFCAKGGFEYRVTSCMKNCKNGPSAKWDGKLIPQADAGTLVGLIEAGKRA